MTKKERKAATTLAIAYAGFYDALDERNWNGAILYSGMVLEAAAVLQITDEDMPSLARIRVLRLDLEHWPKAQLAD